MLVSEFFCYVGDKVQARVQASMHVYDELTTDHSHPALLMTMACLILLVQSFELRHTNLPDCSLPPPPVPPTEIRIAKSLTTINNYY